MESRRSIIACGFTRNRDAAPEADGDALGVQINERIERLDKLADHHGVLVGMAARLDYFRPELGMKLLGFANDLLNVRNCVLRAQPHFDVFAQHFLDVGAWSPGS